MKRINRPYPRPRDLRMKADLMRMGALVEAQFRDVVCADRAISLATMTSRQSELERLQGAVIVSSAAGLTRSCALIRRQSIGDMGMSAVLIALADAGVALARRSERLRPDQATAPSFEAIQGLGSAVLHLLSAVLREYGAGDSCEPLPDAPVEHALEEVAAQLFGDLSGLALSADCRAELFALAKAWERAGDLVVEFWRLYRCANDGVSDAMDELPGAA